jgi:hypothetical protein
MMMKREMDSGQKHAGMTMQGKRHLKFIGKKLSMFKT